MINDVREFLTEVTIERATVDPFSQAKTWATFGTVDAYIWALNGSELIDYGGDNVRATHRMVADVISGITEADRVNDGSKVYEIRYIETKTLYGESWLQVDIEYVGASA